MTEEQRSPATQIGDSATKGKLIGALALVLVVSLGMAAGPSGFAAGSSPKQTCLSYRLEIDKTTFALGEPVEVRIRWSNLCDRALTIEDWRGPLSGVTNLGGGVKDFAVYRLEGYTWTPLPYGEIFSCGARHFTALKARGSMVRSYEINCPPLPAYAIDVPGRYQIRSTYVSGKEEGSRQRVWTGRLAAAPLLLAVVRLSAEQLAPLRKRLAAGDREAMRILVAHRDAKAIPIMAKLLRGPSRELRDFTYEMLAAMGTDEAVRTLGAAAVKEPDKRLKWVAAQLLGRAGRRVAIPFLKQMLKDDYSDGSTLTEENGKTYRILMVRKMAVEALQDLGVADSTKYLVEVRSRPAPHAK